METLIELGSKVRLITFTRTQETVTARTSRHIQVLLYTNQQAKTPDPRKEAEISGQMVAEEFHQCPRTPPKSEGRSDQPSQAESHVSYRTTT